MLTRLALAASRRGALAEEAMRRGLATTVAASTWTSTSSSTAASVSAPAAPAPAPQSIGGPVPVVTERGQLAVDARLKHERDMKALRKQWAAEFSETSKRAEEARRVKAERSAARAEAGRAARAERARAKASSSSSSSPSPSPSISAEAEAAAALRRESYRAALQEVRAEVLERKRRALLRESALWASTEAELVAAVERALDHPQPLFDDPLVPGKGGGGGGGGSSSAANKPRPAAAAAAEAVAARERSARRKGRRGDAAGVAETATAAAAAAAAATSGEEQLLGRLSLEKERREAAAAAAADELRWVCGACGASNMKVRTECVKCRVPAGG